MELLISKSQENISVQLILSSMEQIYVCHLDVPYPDKQEPANALQRAESDNRLKGRHSHRTMVFTDYRHSGLHKHQTMNS